ncbi:hypothetical protein TNCV_1718081 [Trichonephila clavipes]|nr:hypothetical protein TNCV_1718081 [Trichonephila clavipes]
MAPWPRAPVIPQLVDRKTFRDNRWHQIEVNASDWLRSMHLIGSQCFITAMQARNRAVWLRLPKRKHPALPCPAVKTRSLPGITEDLKPGSNLP